MENKTNWWMILGVVIVVAVLASLATVKLTGNVISVSKTVDSTALACYSSCSKNCTSASLATSNSCYSACSKRCYSADVYTKEEVDSLLSSKTTNTAVLSMLNEKCSVWSVAFPNKTRQVTGDDICKERNAGTCILMVNYDRFSSNDMIQKCTPYVTGRSDTTVAYCCTP